MMNTGSEEDFCRCPVKTSDTKRDSYNAEMANVGTLPFGSLTM